MKNMIKAFPFVILFILISVIIFFLIAITVPEIFEKCSDFEKSLPKYLDKAEYCDGGFGDFTEYSEYYYAKDKIAEFQNNGYFKLVEDKDIEHITRYFKHFENNIESFKYKDKYNFHTSQIKENDYFYIKNKSDTEFTNYDVYYVDTNKNVMYFIHFNI